MKKRNHVLKSDKELKKLFVRLIEDIIKANAYVQLIRNLREAQKDFKTEMDQTPGFWSLTAESLREASLLRLSRVYDQQSDTLSLRSLLEIIAGHERFFSKAEILKRVSAAYAEEFQETLHTIKPDQLADDLRAVSKDDPLVKKLVQWRGSTIAHVSLAPLIRTTERRDTLGENDVRELVDRAFDIYNRYLIVFEGSSFSKLLIGSEDYEFLFQLLRLGMEKFDADNGFTSS